MRNGKRILLTLAAIAVTAGVLWLTNRAVTPKEATWTDVTAEAERGGYQLISTDDLWKRCSKGQGSLLVVDTRQEWEYRTGHIQGAVNFPMEPTWLARWREKADLEKLLGKDKDRSVVFY